MIEDNDGCNNEVFVLGIIGILLLAAPILVGVAFWAAGF